MGYIKTLPLPPPRCRSVPHQLPPASAVCNVHQSLQSIPHEKGIFCKYFPEHGSNEGISPWTDC